MSATCVFVGTKALFSTVGLTFEKTSSIRANGCHYGCGGQQRLNCFLDLIWWWIHPESSILFHRTGGNYPTNWELFFQSLECLCIKGESFSCFIEYSFELDANGLSIIMCHCVEICVWRFRSQMTRSLSQVDLCFDWNSPFQHKSLSARVKQQVEFCRLCIITHRSSVALQ